MFASIMESVLLKHLGKYVDGIKNNLDVSIINGDVTIQNISIKPQIVNELKLPFVLKFTHINKIVIKVPWTNLKQKPTIATIQGVYGLFALNYDGLDDDFFDPRERVIEIANRIKQELKKKMQDKTNKQQTFAEKSLIRIIDNLMFSIEDVHIRIQSIKRGWDFSIGFIINSISCNTVDEYGQKHLYTRHFSNKEHNKTLRKRFNFHAIKVYFNEEQKKFLSWQLSRGRQFMIKVLNQPFKNKIKSLSSIDKGYSYQMKTLTQFSFQILGEQYFINSKYVVEVKPQFSKLLFQISDRQFSQILVMLQLIYEWWLNLVKNGQKQFAYPENVKEYFEAVILKLSRDEKITQIQMKNLQKIALQVPLVKLERSADELIRNMRIEKEMKKINKVNNKDKSKKLLQRMFQKIQNEDLDILELFSHISIDFHLPEIKVVCKKNNEQVLEYGLIAIVGKTKLILGKSVFFDLTISELFLRDFTEQKSRNLVKLQEQTYNKQPFMQISFSKNVKSAPVVKVTVKKRYIQIYENTLLSMINWCSEIKLKPALINFINEQLQYSINITQQIFSMLFDHNQLSLHFIIEPPVLNISLEDDELQINQGRIQFKRVQSNRYEAVVEQKMVVSINNRQIVQFKQGNVIAFIKNKDNPQIVQIQVKNLLIHNITTLLDYLYKTLSNVVIQAASNLKLLQEQQIMLQGQFMLNQYLQKQKMMLCGNCLKFMPSGNSISLLKTKVYPYYKNNRYGLIMRQQVDKVINIVYMEQKIMNTLYIRLREHIFQICTILQWNKYYKQFDVCKPIQKIEQVQVIQQNNELIHLIVNFNQILVNICMNEGKSLKCNINKLKGVIAYKEYNTDASAQVNNLMLMLNNEKVIEDLCVHMQYTHLHQMNFLLDVSKFNFNISTYDIIQSITQISGQLTIQIDKIVKKLNVHKEVEDRTGQKTQASGEDIKYLLKACILLKFTNICGLLIGYKNQIKQVQLQVLRYRNMQIPNIQMKVAQVLVLSMVSVGQFRFTNSEKGKMMIGFGNVYVDLHSQMLLYQFQLGKGTKFIESILNLTNVHNTIQYEKETHTPQIQLTITDAYARVKLIQQEDIVVKVKQLSFANHKLQFNRLALFILNEQIIKQNNGHVTIRQKQLFIQTDPIQLCVPLSKIFTIYTQVGYLVESMKSLPILKNINIKRIPTNTQPSLTIKCNGVRVYLKSVSNRPLLKINCGQIDIRSQEQKNIIIFDVQYMNSNIKIYQPFLQQTVITLQLKKSMSQIRIGIDNIRLVLSYELMVDSIRQIIQIQELLKECNRKIGDYIEGGQSTIREYEKYKQLIQIPHRLQMQDEVMVKELQLFKNQIIINNAIPSNILVQIKIDDNKHILQINSQQHKSIFFQVKSEYDESYKMVQKYKKVKVKLSFIHQMYYTKSPIYILSLHDKVPNFYPLPFCDQFGKEIQSAVGLILSNQNRGVYNIEVVSLYRLYSYIQEKITVQWSQGLQIRRQHIGMEDIINIPPWIVDKVSIGLQRLQGRLYDIYLWKHKHDEGKQWVKQTQVYEVELGKQKQGKVSKIMKILIIKQPILSQQPSPTIFKLTNSMYVYNHFHNDIMVNNKVYEYDKCLPLTTIYREQEMEYITLKLGDGSMHQLYLPRPNDDDSFQLKLRQDNYLTIQIKCIPYQEQGSYVYHFYTKLQLTLNFPKLVDPILHTQIYNNWYQVKKEWIRHQNVGEKYEDGQFRNKFYFNSHKYLLGNYERYLVISNSQVKSNKIILYPSIYDEDLCFYDKEETDVDSPLYIYSINYDSTMIDALTTMFYVIVLPKYYIANRSNHVFSVEGRGNIKFNEKVVLGNNKKVQISLHTDSNYVLVNTHYNYIDLSQKRQLVFYHKQTFLDHQRLQKIRKKSRQIRSEEEKVEVEEEQIKQQININVNVNVNVNVQQQRPKEQRIKLQTKNIKLVNIQAQSSQYNTVTYVLQETSHWFHITNELKHTLHVFTHDAQFTYCTIIQPNELGIHPYAMKEVKTIGFMLQVQNEEISIGQYDISLRLHDEMSLKGVQNEITIRESRTDTGRKVTFLYSHTLPKNRQLLLKVSNSMNININNIDVSLVMWPQAERREILKLHIHDSNFMMLRYPSGLYMLNLQTNVSLHSGWVLNHILKAQKLQFYLQGVENEFIQRLSLTTEDKIKVYITDELILRLIEQAQKVIQKFKFITRQKGITYFNFSNKQIKNESYTSNLNSLAVSPIEIMITTRKVIGNQKRKILTSMGFSIIQLQQSCISLSEVKIQELVTDFHIQQIGKMYRKQIIVGCLGGMNMIGNPKQFSQQIQAARHKGWPILGLFSGVIAGSANSVSKIITTLSNGISQLSLDEEYQRQRNQKSLIEPQGFFNGVKLGAFSFAGSLKSGVTGVVERPYEGARKEGGIGFLKGSLQGITGLIVKPVTGIMDATSMTIQGIKSVSSYKNRKQLQQYYLHLERPMYHKFKIVRNYRQEDELAYNIIKKMKKNNVLVDNTQLIQSFILQDDDGKQIDELVIITYQNLFLINLVNDQIILSIKNSRMIATGKFLEGVVLYYDDGKGQQEEIVFRIQRTEKEKENLYWSLKAFINLYSQSGQIHNIAD